MEFIKITKDTECSCLSDAAEDTSSFYLHYIDSPSAKGRDFTSKWERYENKPEFRPSENDCAEVCAWKGVSLNKIDGYDADEVYKLYTEPYRFASEKERSKRRILKLTIKADTGLVKHTPDKRHDSHHDLFKCDTFDVSGIIEVEVSKIEFPE